MMVMMMMMMAPVSVTPKLDGKPPRVAQWVDHFSLVAARSWRDRAVLGLCAPLVPAPLGTMAREGAQGTCMDPRAAQRRPSASGMGTSSGRRVGAPGVIGVMWRPAAYVAN